MLDDYVRQPHLTLDLCGFPCTRPGSPDEFGPDLLTCQFASLRSAKLAPFVIEIGNPDSFESAPYLAIGDLGGGISTLRRCLAINGEHRLFGDYVPHVTLGLYAQAVPFAAVLERLLA
ncbi:MAG: 2'-5' RNA ligase family protein, partial [Betaproteobacteria bacterium]|nr:2'-5' RNA ligase family protein [Betaproteobacteria bacterium]